MSSGQNDPSKTPTTIKIAAKEASKRTSAGADPGPGDLSAAPSVAPQLVDIPEPPTSSQLVVKSSNSRAIKTIQDGQSAGASRATGASGSHHSSKHSTGAAPSQTGAPREPTSSKALSGSSNGHSANSKTKTHSSHASSAKSGLKSATGASGPASGLKSASGASAGAGGPDAESTGGAAEGSAAKSSTGGGGSTSMAPTDTQGATGPSASMAMQADSAAAGVGQQEHDEVEEGEGEVEHPAGTESPSPSMGASAGSPTAADMQSEHPSGGIDTAPASSGGGASKMSPKTSGRTKSSAAGGPSLGASSVKSGASSTTAGSSEQGASGHHGGAGKKKKVTKFRYHKRITVRTHGKNSPSTIMSKVNKKDHNVGMTPSTIEDMDPQELMRRAGIKGNKKTHWRVRLRQTKRLTKNGKTVTQTKVAYRDSEGNKRVRTSSNPNCKHCGKKLEECRCDMESGK